MSTSETRGQLKDRRLPDLSQAAWGQQSLPYGMTVAHIIDAMHNVYAILDDMSRPLIARGIGRVEDFMLGNSLSGLISELLVQGLARTTGMKRNVLVGGFPDLLPLIIQATVFKMRPMGSRRRRPFSLASWKLTTSSSAIFCSSSASRTCPIPSKHPSMSAGRWSSMASSLVASRIAHGGTK